MAGCGAKGEGAPSRTLPKAVRAPDCGCERRGCLVPYPAPENHPQVLRSKAILLSAECGQQVECIRCFKLPPARLKATPVRAEGFPSASDMQCPWHACMHACVQAHDRVCVYVCARMRRASKKGYDEVHVPALKAKPYAAGERLVSISELPDWTQPAFAGMKELNRIQVSTGWEPCARS